MDDGGECPGRRLLTDDGVQRRDDDQAAGDVRHSCCSLTASRIVLACLHP